MLKGKKKKKNGLKGGKHHKRRKLELARRSRRRRETAHPRQRCSGNILKYSQILTIVWHVAVSSLEHQVDAVASSADLLHRLAVGHPRRAVPVDLHKLIADLQPRRPQFIFNISW